MFVKATANTNIYRVLAVTLHCPRGSEMRTSLHSPNNPWKQEPLFSHFRGEEMEAHAQTPDFESLNQEVESVCCFLGPSNASLGSGGSLFGV